MAGSGEKKYLEKLVDKNKYQEKLVDETNI